VQGPGPGGRRPQGPPAGGGQGARRLPGIAGSEVANFIDGKRTALDIYNAVRAECGNLVVGHEETKFAYLLSPDAPDVELDMVLETLENLKKAGTIEIQKVAPKADAKKGRVKK
jgi:hypothetical protein